jgi:hypothetical protein
MRIELFPGENIEFAIGPGFSVGGTAATIKKCHFSKKVTASEGSEMVTFAPLKREQNTHNTTAHQKDFIAFIAMSEYQLIGPH